MRHFITVLPLLITTICLACAAGQSNNDFEPLLSHLHLSADQAQLERGRWRDGGKYSLPAFNRIWDDWRQLDPYAVASGRDALKAAGSFRQLLDCAARHLSVDLPAPAKPAKSDADLARAIVGLQAYLNSPLSPEQITSLGHNAAKVPADVRRAAVHILKAVPPALEARKLAFAKCGADLSAIYDRAIHFGIDFDVPDESILKLVDGVDMHALLTGACGLAEAMDAAGSLKPSKRKYHFEWSTPIGKISLNGADDDLYDAAPYLAIIDTGGNDTYRFASGTKRLDCPISVIVDVAGNDTYVSDVPGAFGAGILGYGFLLDCAGDDTYTVGDVGLGAGIFGVGMAIDRAGKDKYSIHRLGEGAGTCGVGVLSDLAGDDTYHCMQLAQGFGGVRGCGILVDRTGNDTYEADDTHIDYPSPQTAQHNVSMAQGAGFGRRPDQGDVHYMAGGVGLLVDGEGNDTYRCGVFGQGVAYWYALGMLVDFGGNDSYQGVWYVQGSAAHYSVAALCDLGGNDTYSASMAQSQGQGHDFSIGLLHDYAGDDSYSCPGGCCGSGRYNGIGLFEDSSGHDVYKTGRASLGEVGESRPESLCLGLFIGSPNATFPTDNPAKPGSLWVLPEDKAHPLSHAAGMAR